MADADDGHYLLSYEFVGQCLQIFNRSSLTILPTSFGVWALIYHHFASPQLLKRLWSRILFAHINTCLHIFAMLSLSIGVWEQFFQFLPPLFLQEWRAVSTSHSTSSWLPIHDIYTQHINFHNQKFVTSCTCVVQNNIRKRFMDIFINGHEYTLDISASHEIICIVCNHFYFSKSGIIFVIDHQL